MLFTIKGPLPRVAALVLLLTTAAIVCGQTPAPDPKEVVLQQIRADAIRHVQG